MKRILIMLVAFLVTLSEPLRNSIGGVIYTPVANAIATILNRRSESHMVEALTENLDFDHLILTGDQFGDTMEHIDTALSESEAYDPTNNDMADYKKTVLNKYYNTINFSKVYLTSTPDAEYSKALKNAVALAALVNKVLGKQGKTWRYDQYVQFIALMEGDTDLKETYVPIFTGIQAATVDARKILTENFLQVVTETVEKMRFYSADYISVDSNLTAPEIARFIATAPSNKMTLYLNSTYYTWSQVDLSLRFRNLLDLNKDLKIKIIDFADADRIGYITHDLRHSWRPKSIVAKQANPFKALRVDHSLIVEGTFAKVPLYPGTVFVPSANFPLAPS